MPETTPPPNDHELFQRLLQEPVPPDVITARGQAIGARLLLNSPRLRSNDFTAIASGDLGLLFDLYDESVFAGQLRRLLQKHNRPLSFKLSRRLTRSAGTTTQFRHRLPEPGQPATCYEIAISATLLFQSFADVERTVRVSGLVCLNRVEALQRVFEHELL